MSLDVRITALAQAMGADVKALQSAGHMRGFVLVKESVPADAAETIPPGYQLQVHGTFDVVGSLDIQGKLVLL